MEVKKNKLELKGLKSYLCIIREKQKTICICMLENNLNIIIHKLLLLLIIVKLYNYYYNNIIIECQ